MSEGFFSRWSRRKQEAVQTLEAPVAQRDAEPVPAPDATLSLDAGSGEAEAAVPASPTLEEARSLTPEADFQPFMQPGVGAEVRNAALKKLFADPHFNVMDGLDIYIDDYSQPDPMSAGMLRQMASAQFLRLVPEETGAAPSLSAQDPAQVRAAGSPPEVVAQSPDPSAKAAPPQHEDPDLQLQPDPAPADPGAGSRPG